MTQVSRHKSHQGLISTFSLSPPSLATLAPFVLAETKQGNQNVSQHMMRARIFAQGATVALMVGSSGAIILPSFLGGSAK